MRRCQSRYARVIPTSAAHDTGLKGVAVFRYVERVGGADVIFGEEGDSRLLGAFTLEALGLSLDPLRRELKPLTMLLARLLRTAG